MFFLVIIYGCESSTVKKTVCQRTDAFELWCWRRLLRVPRTARRSNQSILKEINPEYSLERLMLKLKLQYFWPPDEKSWLLRKILMLGKIGGRRRRGWQRIRCLDNITDSMETSLSKLQETVKDGEAWHVVVHGVTRSQIWLSDWTTTKVYISLCIKNTLMKFVSLPEQPIVVTESIISVLIFINNSALTSSKKFLTKPVVTFQNKHLFIFLVYFHSATAGCS